MKKILQTLLLCMGVACGWAERLNYSADIGWGYCEDPTYASLDVTVGKNIGEYAFVGAYSYYAAIRTDAVQLKVGFDF